MKILLLDNYDSFTYNLHQCLRELKAGTVDIRFNNDISLAEVADYDAIVAAGRLLPPVDHPDPAHWLVTGTGFAVPVTLHPPWLVLLVLTFSVSSTFALNFIVTAAMSVSASMLIDGYSSSSA